MSAGYGAPIELVSVDPGSGQDGQWVLTPAQAVAIGITGAEGTSTPTAQTVATASQTAGEYLGRLCPGSPSNRHPASGR